jgi:RNA polymerase sigma-70 factor (ECF subfamily)
MTATSDDAEADAFGSTVAAAATGDADALGKLFELFHPRLLRYLRAREGRVADDIAGETWIAIARGIRTFEGDAGAFAAWIFTIARQRLADHRRTGARRRTDPVAVVPDMTSPPSDRDALDSLSAQDAVDFVARTLTEDQAEVVLLRTLAGLRATEVAQLMGRDDTWVRVTHHRAIAKLREQMKREHL